MNVYVAGPITGYPDHNRAAFRIARLALADAGIEVSDPTTIPEPPCPTWDSWMRQTLRMMLECDGVATLPGWQESRGATLEVRVAHALGMQVMPLERWLTA